jgi:hypothetical protein
MVPTMRGGDVLCDPHIASIAGAVHCEQHVAAYFQLPSFGTMRGSNRCRCEQPELLRLPPLSPMASKLHQCYELARPFAHWECFDWRRPIYRLNKGFGMYVLVWMHGSAREECLTPYYASSMHLPLSHCPWPSTCFR